MTNLQRHIGMCTKNHARWKRMASFARTREERDRYIERSIFWLEMQTALVSLWAVEQKSNDVESRKILTEAKSNLLVKIANYGKTIEDEEPTF